MTGETRGVAARPVPRARHRGGRSHRARAWAQILVLAMVAAELATIGPSSSTSAGAAAAARPVLAAGSGDTCALLAGSVDCWGHNNAGQLGDGTTTNRNAPTPVPGLTGVTAITAGANHTCALLAGSVDCWGLNNDGQLGDGTTTNRNAPTPVPGLTGVTAITAGANHTCALLAGSVDCWGLNNDGQLGDGTTTNRNAPTPVPGLTGVTAITAGKLHTCALLTSRLVKCWGYNSAGQLGNGTTVNKRRPVAVVGLTSVTSISAGNFHTCAMSMTRLVRCWGSNTYGQLGDGTTRSRRTPRTIPGLTGVATIAAGADHTCALMTAGTVKCWGLDSQGQLGDGNTVGVLRPKRVPGLVGVRAIATGDLHTCSMSANGTTECWGNNAYGELGNGSTANGLFPSATSAPTVTAPTTTTAPVTPTPTTAAPTTTTPPISSANVASMLASLKLVNYYPHDHGWSLMWSSFDPTEINHDFSVIRSIGANSVRVIIQAYAVGFPNPTPTGLSELSQIVALAHSNGLTAQLCLFDWLSDWTNISGSTTWANAILGPFKSDPRISFVEVHNELDVTNSAALSWASAMVPVVHAAAGNIPVTISLPGNAPANALQIMKQTFGSTLDFYDVHYYGDPNAARATLAADKATVAPSPLYVGESGVSTGTGGAPSSPTLEQQQATFFTALNAAAAANGIGLPAPWVLQDFTDNSLTWVGPTSIEYHYGLLRTDGTAKPAFAVERSAFGG